MNFPILKRQREAHGLTQSEFSVMIGVSQAMISLFENGQRKPTEAIADKISSLLKIPVEELIGEPPIKTTLTRNISTLNARQLRILNDVAIEFGRKDQK